MHRLRSTWMQRALAWALALSILPAGGVWPESSWAGASTSATYADWLRADVLEEASDDVRTAFDRAVTEALQADPRSLNSFLQHLSRAVARQAPAQALAAWMGSSVNAEAWLLQYFHQQLAQVRGVQAGPRLRAALQGAAASASAVGGGGNAVVAGVQGLRMRAVPSVQHAGRAAVPGLLHILFAAQPLGP